MDLKEETGNGCQSNLIEHPIRDTFQDHFFLRTELIWKLAFQWMQTKFFGFSHNYCLVWLRDGGWERSQYLIAVINHKLLGKESSLQSSCSYSHSLKKYLLSTCHVLELFQVLSIQQGINKQSCTDQSNYNNDYYYIFCARCCSIQYSCNSFHPDMLLTPVSI